MTPHPSAFGCHLPPLGKACFVRPESLSTCPRKRCFCGHKNDVNTIQKLDYSVIKALKSSVSLTGSKQRLLFKQRIKSSTSVITESVTGCSSSISENSGAVNLICRQAAQQYRQDNCGQYGDRKENTILRSV